MKTIMITAIILAAAACAAVAGNDTIKTVKLKEVPFTKVTIKDSFWAPRQETNRVVSIPHNLQMLEKAGNIPNFDLAIAGKHEGYSGPFFMDSDLYKGIEAACYSLSTHPDPKLDKQLDDIIAKIAAAQMKDGYINTFFQVVAPQSRWTNLRDQHELYCSGHMIEAAVAHYQATGKRTLLDVAIKNANHIDSIFGSGPGKRMGYPGHPELELALIKLWRITGDKRYFDLSKFMVDSRGSKFFATEHNTPLSEYNGAYWQDDYPIKDQNCIVGHAVRAAYLLSGATDIAAETNDKELFAGINRIWQNTTQRNTYITGGIGPSASNEGFTVDYDLPNYTAYQETCASVAMAMWNHRLSLVYGDTSYADYMERALYNGVTAGASLDGTKYFYTNRLASSGDQHRTGWFGCACCPPNVARTFAAIGQYAYATSDDALWVNLYIQGSTTVDIKGKSVKFDVLTDYPWDGYVKIKPTVSSPMAFGIRLRVPDWCSGATVKVNSQQIQKPTIERGYIVINRTWKTGDVVELSLPMPIQKIESHPKAQENKFKLALQRGPIIYCLEGCDQPIALNKIAISLDLMLKPEKRANLLGGVVVLKGTAHTTPDSDWSNTLYRAAKQPKPVTITAVPYCTWDNREPCPMMVWIPTTLQVAAGPAANARVNSSFEETFAQMSSVNDGVMPANSADKTLGVLHWWPRKGTEEWAQYTWDKPVALEEARIYWFDDEPQGDCRVPQSWKLEYMSAGKWVPVKPKSDYPILKNGLCSVKFEPIKTTALRAVVQSQKGWSAGILEWEL